MRPSRDEAIGAAQRCGTPRPTVAACVSTAIVQVKTASYQTNAGSAVTVRRAAAGTAPAWQALCDHTRRHWLGKKRLCLQSLFTCARCLGSVPCSLAAGQTTAEMTFAVTQKHPASVFVSYGATIATVRFETVWCTFFARQNSSMAAESTAQSITTLRATRGFNTGPGCESMKKSIGRWGHRPTGLGVISGNGPASFQNATGWSSDDGTMSQPLHTRTDCVRMAPADTNMHDRPQECTQDGNSASPTAFRSLKTLGKAACLQRDV